MWGVAAKYNDPDNLEKDLLLMSAGTLLLRNLVWMMDDV